jgi:hypothetical protein
VFYEGVGTWIKGDFQQESKVHTEEKRGGKDGATTEGKGTQRASNAHLSV